MDNATTPDTGQGPWGVRKDEASGFYYLTRDGIDDGRTFPLGKTAYRAARKLNDGEPLLQAVTALDPFLEDEPGIVAGLDLSGSKAEVGERYPDKPKAKAKPKAPKVAIVVKEAPGVLEFSKVFQGSREEWLNAFMSAARPVFKRNGFELPEKVRISVGFMFRSPKAIGQCWHESASADGTREVFINPIMADSARVAGIVTHELCHTLFGPEEKHGRSFKKAAYGMGLEGKATATTEGDDWREWAFPILRKLGSFPHAAIDPASSGMKKQTTRLLKCECEDCGFIFRATAKHVNGKALRCPDDDCGGVVRVDGGDED